ncbi:hypothetical protein [Pseudomonas sp. CGJS7]|uniref:hypothetical protein n=1 Tax=Pseudomonas sp. CGJS7 TaxID=3109348 RepID=UPI00300ADCB8
MPLLMQSPRATRRFPFVLILAALALLAGCSTTAFESPPSGAQVACDPRLVGNWLSGEWGEQGASAPKRGDEDTEAMSIRPKDCGLIVRSTGQCPSDLIGYTFSYLPDRTGGYIIATEATQATEPDSCRRMDARQSEESDDDAQSLRGRYMLLRYRLGPDRIAIHAIDTPKIARMILTGKLRGSVENQAFGIEDRAIGSIEQFDALLRRLKVDDDEPQLAASVRGTSAQVDALLASRKDLFFATPGAVLIRDGKPPAPAAAKKPAVVGNASR